MQHYRFQKPDQEYIFLSFETEQKIHVHKTKLLAVTVTDKTLLMQTNDE